MEHADKLKATDVVIAMGTVSGNAALDLLFEHYYAKVTFNVVLASQFNPETDTISEFFVVTCDGDYVKPYIDGNSYTALVPANPYFKAGVHFALVTINGERFEVLIPDEYANPNRSLVAGTHYTFDRKPGTGCITKLNDHLWEGRFTPTVNGKRMSRNVYAHTEEECEEKLAQMIREMKIEIEKIKQGG